MSGPDADTLTLDPPAAEVPLRRNRNFQLLWTGSVFAALGREISYLAYPLLILAVTGSPGWAGTFGGVQILSSLLFGLPAGVVADRYDRRRLLVVAETVKTLATASVVVALLADGLTLAHLLAVAVIAGAVQPLGGSAQMLMVRAVVPPDQLTAALTQEEVRAHGAAVSGPPLSGALYGVASALPLIATAVSFVISLVCISFVRTPAAAPAAPASPAVPARETPLARLLLGGRVLWSTPTLRLGMLFAAAMNAVYAPLVLIVVVVLRNQHASAGRIGLITTALAVGGLAGTALVRPLHRALPPGRLMLWLGASTVALMVLLAVPAGQWWLAAVLFLLGLGGPAFRVLVDVLIFRQVPDEQRGRVVTTFMTILGLGASSGVFISGLLLEHLSASRAVLFLAGVSAAALCLGAASRNLRTAQWPHERESEPHGQ